MLWWSVAHLQCSEMAYIAMEQAAATTGSTQGAWYRKVLEENIEIEVLLNNPGPHEMTSAQCREALMDLERILK